MISWHIYVMGATTNRNSKDYLWLMNFLIQYVDSSLNGIIPCWRSREHLVISEGIKSILCNKCTLLLYYVIWIILVLNCCHTTEEIDKNNYAIPDLTKVVFVNFKNVSLSITYSIKLEMASGFSVFMVFIFVFI